MVTNLHWTPQQKLSKTTELTTKFSVHIPRSYSRPAAAGLVPPFPLSVKYPLADHLEITGVSFFQLKNLTSGVVNWEPDFAIGLARRLDLAITFSPRLYAKDIDIALKIITTLFDYESKQNSSTLVSARTKEFAKVRKWKPCNPLFSVPRRYQHWNCRNVLRIPTCERLTSWLFMKREGIEFGTTKLISIKWQGSRGLEPGTWGLHESSALSATPSPLNTNTK